MFYVKAPMIAALVSVLVTILLTILLILLYFMRRKKQMGKYQQYQKITENQTITSKLTPSMTVKTLKYTKRPSSYENKPDEESSDEEIYRQNAQRVRKAPSPLISDDEQIEGAEEGSEEIAYPEGHCGRIWFSLEYNYDKGHLQVHLTKARNLSHKEAQLKKCDPFVKLSILPEQGAPAPLQSRYHRNTRNPDFQENFHFPMPIHELRTRMLRMTVCGGDRLQHIVMGHVMYALWEMDISNKLDLWRDIESVQETAAAEIGELHVSISYYPALDRLTIIILRGSNLRCGAVEATEVYVKVSLSMGNKIIKTKKTTTHKGSSSPLINESLNFQVSNDDLATASLLISVMHSDKTKSKEGKLIGRLLLGGMMYARGKELEHWNEMVSQPKTMVKYWHTLNK